MSTVTLPNPSLTRFVVKQLKPGKHKLSEAELATNLQEVEVQTQIAGASFLKLHVIDPEWTVQTSGLVAVNEDGLLNELELEFPEGSGYWWQLAAVEGSTEIAQANLVLTFEDRVVARLREQWGHRTFPPGLSTRAQVVKALVHEANLKEHLNPPLRFMSPGQNRKEPVAEAKKSKTSTAKKNEEAAENRERGIHAGAEFRIKGQAPSPAQRALLNEALGVANEVAAGPLPSEALIEACIAENTVSTSGAGFLQFEAATAAGLGITKGNVKQEVTAFLTRSYSGETLAAGPGGAIEYAQKHPNAPAYEIAQAVQGSGAGKASKGAANYGPFHVEAQEILTAGGGVKAGGTTSNSNESDVGQLSRGTPTNPDEDSWDCITRLAAEVDWFAFTDGRNTLFYMDGPDFIAQKPKCYINVVDNHVVKEDGQGRRVEETGAIIRPVTYTYDNTAFLYRKTHKVKGRIQRKSRIAKPQTPSEVRMTMVCGVSEFRAGDVFVFRNCGPISENGGRWIVSDATRECLKYPYTKFILVPPTAPLPEPKASKTTGEAGTGAAGAFEAANALSQLQLPYLWGGGHGPKGLLGITKTSAGLDCSGSACWVLKQAGMFPADSAVVSGDLERFGEPGKGQEMTVWANATHTFLEFTVSGHGRAQMNTNGPQNGPRLYTLEQTATYNMDPEHEGFTARHFAGT
jgi:hypothetical protein